MKMRISTLLATTGIVMASNFSFANTNNTHQEGTPIVSSNKNAMTPSKTIVFIHGLFVKPDSWDQWENYFEKRGYTCYTPANPYHEVSKEELWDNTPKEFGDVTFEDLTHHLAEFIDTLPEKPILIGHSLGGLAVQKLVEMGKAEAGICIDGAAPRGVITTKWSYIKSNYPVINPFKGNSVFYPTKEWFYYAIGNTLTRTESDQVFDEYVVPTSRNIPRGTLKKFGKIDFKKPHVPLLFIAGEEDRIIPMKLNKKNFEKYKDTNSKRDFKVFKGRGHYIVGDKNWEEVATYIYEWIK
jgi:pimeloyl-ACP methyl ester carboxylesterase